MFLSRRWVRLRALVKDEWVRLSAVRSSDRPWQMPFAAAFAIGVPLLFGAGFDQMGAGLIASLGGLVFMYLPPTPLQHRMLTLMACAFGMIACFTLGVLCHLQPMLAVPVLGLTATGVTMVGRLYQVGPPGSLFFLMAAAIGADAPGPLTEVPMKVGLVALGTLGAVLIAFIYSVLILRSRVPKPAPAVPVPSFDFVVFDALLIGVSVGACFLVARLLELDKTYWVAVSCLAVIQGVNRRSIWERQIHRVTGTAAGLVLAWGLFVLTLNPWAVALLVMTLAFLIENLVVRHYGVAAVFITPLAILMGDAAHFPLVAASPLIQARFFDTLIGSLIGFAGGMAIHSERVRARLGPVLRRWLGAPAGIDTGKT